MRKQLLTLICFVSLFSGQAYCDDKAPDAANAEKQKIGGSIGGGDSEVVKALNPVNDESGAASEDLSAAPAIIPGQWLYPPVIHISKWGKELRIVVEPSILMDEQKIAAIQSVRLESEQGQFLGLKTFGPQEVKRRGEFMINPELLKADKVKVIMNSSEDGDWAALTPLKASSEENAEAVAEPAEAVKSESKAEDLAKVEIEKPEPKSEKTAEPVKTKKRGWFW